MIKEDYLMRQLSDFLEALSRLLSDNQGNLERKVETFYKTFTKFDNDFYKDNDIEYILTTLKSTTNENEFRILTLVNENNLDKVIKINNIYKFVEGIVVGQNISDENCFILHQLVDGNTIIRRIHFDNIITRIQDI